MEQSKKISRKVISVVLSLLMVMSCFSGLSLTAYAAGSGKENDPWTVGSPNADDVTAWLGDDGTLHISGTGEIRECYAKNNNKLKQYVAPWKTSQSKIKKVEIEEGVTRIGEYAFYQCLYFTSIEIPETVTSIGKSAFSSCQSLTSVKIPEGVTSIEYSTFNNCQDLVSVEIPDTVTKIGIAAFESTALTSVKIPDGVTEIGGEAFAFCENLASANIPASVTFIGSGAFNGCNNLSDDTIPDGMHYESNGDWQPLTLNVLTSSWDDLNIKMIYTVTFDSDGGSDVEAQTVDKNEYASKPTDPTREGYTFDGWYAEDATTAFDFDNTPITASVTLYAVWQENISNGWVLDNGIWYYYEDGEATTGWALIDNKWYYFNEDGEMQTGWVLSPASGRWFYLDASGAMVTGWKKLDRGQWYYFDVNNGAAAQGWKNINGKWYYFNICAMQTGWRLLNGKWYYLNSDGSMRTANLTYKGKVYKFNKSGACINP